MQDAIDVQNLFLSFRLAACGVRHEDNLDQERGHEDELPDEVQATSGSLFDDEVTVAPVALVLVLLLFVFSHELILKVLLLEE